MHKVFKIHNSKSVITSMKNGVMIALLTLFLSGAAYSSAAVWVNTRSGPVIGSEVLQEGKVVKRFLGIPYAQPPVGKLRFEKPVPVQPWSRPFLATTYQPSCPQDYPFAYPWVDKMPRQREDCLHLNIWVPETASRNTPKSVMFWIHGGSFFLGSNRLSHYDGQVLAAEYDVIVVTVNYRLGILGFLTTGSEEEPLNMGLYDILEALKWVNNNIEAFGGNSTSITLFGQSAASTTCAFFIVSPLARGLFQRIIMQSGSPTPEHWDIYSRNLELGQKVATSLDCASETSTLENNPGEVVRCLRGKSAEDLNEGVRSVLNTSIRSFRPVYGDDFLPMNPFDAVQQNDYQPVDLMIGRVRDEGSFAMGAAFPDIFGPYGEKNPRINISLGREIIKNVLSSLGSRDEIADYYLSDLREDDYDIVRSQTYHARGDYITFCPSIYFAQLFSSKGNNVYSYYYNHQTANTVFAQWMGVTHFMEVPLVFGRPFDSPGYSEGDRIISKQLMESWTNFAKNGFPSSTWKKFSKPEYYTEQIQISDNCDNSFIDHLNNCEFLRQYMFD